jgi:hypothetical protein
LIWISWIPVTVAEGQTVTISKALDHQLQTWWCNNNDYCKQTKESALLLDQKNAVEIKQSIGTRASQKGVSDVASAVTKVVGF